MRIIRFTSSNSYDYWEPSWGLLVDQFVYPLLRAPYIESDFYYESNALRFAPQIKDEALALEDVRLLPPAQPSKILCVGRNYAEHAAELGNDVPEQPLIFLKTPSSLVGPGDDVVHPEISQRVDHEAELALVIGKRCRYLTEDEVDDVIFGYTLANDVTARDLQQLDKQWARAKGFDTFGPLGPWLDTEFDPRGRTVRCLVNHEVRQESNTDLMIFSIRQILVYLSRAMTLEPGDLILTGTPAGVGPVQPGDVMTVEIEGLGRLTNPVISEEEAIRKAEEEAQPHYGNEVPF